MPGHSVNCSEIGRDGAEMKQERACSDGQNGYKTAARMLGTVLKCSKKGKHNYIMKLQQNARTATELQRDWLGLCQN